MSFSKVGIFVIGLVCGAFFLGDQGADAIRLSASAMRAGLSGVMTPTGDGLREMGDTFAEDETWKN